jgi:hypothetical protein
MMNRIGPADATVIPFDEDNHYDPVESKLLEKIESLLNAFSANEPELASTILELSDWQVANGKGLEGSLRKYHVPAVEVRSPDGGNTDPVSGLIYPRRLEVQFRAIPWDLDPNSREILSRARQPKSPSVRLHFRRPFVMRKVAVKTAKFGTVRVTIADIAFHLLELEFPSEDEVLWEGAGVSTGWYPDPLKPRSKEEIERDTIERWKRELEETA